MKLSKIVLPVIIVLSESMVVKGVANVTNCVVVKFA